MRLFSYLDQNKQKRVGLLRATDSKEFIDVAATDPSLPASLCDIIATEGAMARVGQLLTQPSAVIRDLAGVTYIPQSQRLDEFSSPSWVPPRAMPTISPARKTTKEVGDVAMSSHWSSPQPTTSS